MFGRVVAVYAARSASFSTARDVICYAVFQLLRHSPESGVSLGASLYQNLYNLVLDRVGNDGPSQRFHALKMIIDGAVTATGGLGYVSPFEFEQPLRASEANGGE
jgi:hypothetical protein